MKNKTFVSVPITQEIIEKLEANKYYSLLSDGDIDFMETFWGEAIKHRATWMLKHFNHILLEQPSLPIEGKTENSSTINSTINSTIKKRNARRVLVKKGGWNLFKKKSWYKFSSKTDKILH